MSVRIALDCPGSAVARGVCPPEVARSVLVVIKVYVIGGRDWLSAPCTQRAHCVGQHGLTHTLMCIAIATLSVVSVPRHAYVHNPELETELRTQVRTSHTATLSTVCRCAQCIVDCTSGLAVTLVVRWTPTRWARGIPPFAAVARQADSPQPAQIVTYHHR